MSEQRNTEKSIEKPRSEARQKVGFVSLGCPKNLVDSEVMMGLLARAGAELTRRAEDADVIVVNTCSFIESAQQESVNTILEMAAHKTGGKAKKLVVAGCLVERFRDQIRKDIPEVDAVVGTGELEKILAATGMASAPVRNEFPVRRLAIASRRRRPRRARPILPRELGWIRRRPSQLPLRRSHAAHSRDARPHGLHQDRRRLRSSLHLLHHSPAARTVPLAPLRVRSRRSRTPRAMWRPRNHPDRPGHDLLRRRLRPERRPRPAARKARLPSKICAGFASSTPIPTRSPASCWTRSRSTKKSAPTWTSPCSTPPPQC